jgi:demethylmenaquinone methyltransferase / 2-methoxy-6-polyprenyl-1,4-benzoquinol methylase
MATTPHGGSGQMFDRIAGRYDLLNRIISLGMDRGWRRKLVEALQLGAGAAALDVATGTGDVALTLASAHPDARIVGLDPSAGMLEVGRTKVAAAGLTERIELTEGDAQDMPFGTDTFDGSCISFGIRNVPDRVQGLREMARVTKPGGRVCVLELGEPRAGVLTPFARFHVHQVVPRLGALLSGETEYHYLQASIAAFPAPEAFCDIMRDAGLHEVSFTAFQFGAVNLYVGRV